MIRAFALGLGGNLGDVRGNLQVCIRTLLEDSQVSELKISSFYKSSPWGVVEGGEFLNAAVSGLWHGTDLELLLLCRSIESRFSVPVKKNGAARALDVDILFLDGGVSISELVLPHPRMTLRKFVLVPLCDVWSEAIPGLGKTPATLLKHVKDSSSIIFHGDLNTVEQGADPV